MLLLLACAHEPPSALPTPAPVHAAAAERARDALLFNDFETWALSWGRAAEDSSVPEATRTEWRAAATAAGLGAASESLGQLTTACGTCHTRSGAVLPTPASWSVAGDGVRAEMERHAQGLDQIWFGVIRPSKDDVAAGARTLRQSLLFLSAPEGGGMAEVMDDEVTMAANAVEAAGTDAARATAFARLLQACANCHAARPGGLSLEPE